MSDPKEENFRCYVDEDEGELVIEWDIDHPDAALFQEWTEDDWIDAIKKGSKMRLEEKGDG